MYFSPAQIIESILALSKVHPFYGISFLTCKAAQLPVGNAIVFPLDAKTDLFLQKFHRLDPKSNAFFQPFKSNNKEKKWINSDYSASGLQAINTQTFANAFIHDRGSRVWGWKPEYIDELKDKLPKKQTISEKIPAFHMAVWLYRDFEWPEHATSDDVLRKFFNEFNINSEEIHALFEVKLPEYSSAQGMFQVTKFEWRDISQALPAPPDATPDQGGTLTYLSTKGIGPADMFELKPARRLSLITGDNGLGKSFLLEAAWWALTGTWAEKAAFPRRDLDKDGKGVIQFEIEGMQSKAQRNTATFDRKTLSWLLPKKRPTIAGLAIYARVDGSFAVWDPARVGAGGFEPLKAVFTSRDAWDGLNGQIEGLVRDWVRWQHNPSGGQFETFAAVLETLSPPDLGKLTPGSTVRVPNDPREIPTLKHPYGEVPITNESAGVRRVITLAYLLVWSWHEHLIAAQLANTEPQRRMVVLIDEIEAHLHPRWQLTLLPAMMKASESLSTALDVQYLIATHSPLVMASSEAVFNSDTDKLFHLDMQNSGEIELGEVEFTKYGDVSAWLTSPVFELRHARSSQGGAAIDSAKALQLAESVESTDVVRVNAELVEHLAPDDRFWPRWVSFAEKFGVMS